MRNSNRRGRRISDQERRRQRIQEQEIIRLAGSIGEEQQGGPDANRSGGRVPAAADMQTPKPVKSPEK